MPCILALIVLSILSVFSASHRKLAREAFACVFRRVTLRPCNTGFDTKVKAAVLGRLINRSPKVAGFVGRRFEIIAWVFFIAMTLSFLWTARGIYNFWAWGDCNGANSGGFCAFDPTGANSKVSAVDEASCTDSKLAAKALNMKPLTLADYPTKTSLSPAADKQIVFIGCFNCDYTRKAWPMIKDVVSKTAATLIFIEFPSKPETKYLMPYDYCLNQLNPDKYWQYAETMLKNDKDVNASAAAVTAQIAGMGVDMKQFSACLVAPETKKAVDKEYQDIQKTGIYGTPTVFINGTPVVGPKPERVYRRLLFRSWL